MIQGLPTIDARISQDGLAIQIQIPETIARQRDVTGALTILTRELFSKEFALEQYNWRL